MQGPHEAIYFQMYMTGKAVTYNPECGHHGKAMMIEATMDKSQPPPFLEGLVKVYIDVMHCNSLNTCVELCVPF